MAKSSQRQMAAHVQAAIASAGQAKMPGSGSGGRSVAAHVQAAIASAGQAKVAKVPDRAVAAHVQTAIAGEPRSASPVLQPATVAVRQQPPRRGKRKRSDSSNSRTHPMSRAHKKRKLDDGSGDGGGDPPKPNKCLTGKDLWNGTRRQMRWLDYDDTLDQLSPTTGTSSKGKKTYQCVRCGNLYPRKSDIPRNQRRTKRHIEVDHKTSALDFVLMHADPKRFTLGDNCWEAYYLEDILKAYNDLRNLQLLCSFCNPSKSGRKDIDKSDPTRYLGKKK